MSLHELVLRLGQGEPVAPLLAAVGEPEPERADAALQRAARHPDLAPALQSWVPELVLSARPGFAAQGLVQLADRYRELRGRALDVVAHPQLPPLLGNSDFLARLLLRHPLWCEELHGTEPAWPAPDELAADWSAIRAAKYRGLLRIAARDRAGAALPDTLRQLSDLADRCLRAGLERAAADEPCAPPVLLALGKLGGRELNFSSDVDLLFLHEPDARLDPGLEKQQLTRVVQRLKRELEVRSDEGFAYRVDLNLRPEGRSGALINSVDAALEYYEAFGAPWERQMLIRLRHVAGPKEPGLLFAGGLEPFVYRRGIDLRAIAEVRDMKARIEDERRRAGRDLEADLKEGPGGIRDVEFFAQALQLLHGGRRAPLRRSGLLESLSALAELELIPQTTLQALREGYLWLRRAEHALQLVEERQTHRFPRESAAQLALARRMGYAEWSGTAARGHLLDDWVRVRAEVRRHFEALVLGRSADG